MAKRIGLEASLACSEAVRLADADVVAAYPITPQTHIVEHLSELVADGHLDAEFVPVESEHSAMSACVGSAAAGARTFTATSSQGLALMNEVLYIASGMRLPMVMAVANRALSAPISIWNDHSDVMAARDCGWIQYFCENGQEVMDLTLAAFKITEDPRVMLPIMVNMDGFTLTHVIEPIEIPEQDDVKKYLPPYEAKFKLDTDNPMTFGAVGVPEVYTELRKQLEVALQASKPVVKEHLDGLNEVFGRKYDLIETNNMDGAETVLITMGSTGETAMTAIDEMRADGQKVGQVRIRLWRPFPEEEFMAAIAGAKRLVVIDRALSYGSVGGPVATELRALLSNKPDAPQVASFIAGLGGRDITKADFKEMFDLASEQIESGRLFDFFGVRED